MCRRTPLHYGPTRTRSLLSHSPIVACATGAEHLSTLGENFEFSIKGIPLERPKTGNTSMAEKLMEVASTVSSLMSTAQEHGLELEAIKDTLASAFGLKKGEESEGKSDEQGEEEEEEPGEDEEPEDTS
ncbi:PREDICTED: uncharacterized protein LOC109480716 [Branchiostoma belcheri]|uniref:Uncharacterized protein LOC109480716 n=1 Tax=Branchiostoma belcheri TaxID=7741 RepID=A0A6P4ZAX3_BRABE|nr:PREDICTED: uncharacterized protein LOC109480716 [Branchiostoma belcheri]